MLNFISKLFNRLTSRFYWPQPRYNPDEAIYRADPLRHPDLMKMSERQLADLPFDPTCFRDEISYQRTGVILANSKRPLHKPAQATCS